MKVEEREKTEKVTGKVIQMNPLFGGQRAAA